MATKLVIQQPKPLMVAAASDQWSTSICECDNVNECNMCVCVYVCLYKLRFLRKKVKSLTAVGTLFRLMFLASAFDKTD